MDKTFTGENSGDRERLLNRAALQNALQRLSITLNMMEFFGVLLLTRERANRFVTIIQVGAYVGASVNDPICGFIKKRFKGDHKNRAVLVEPVDFLFKQLVENYSDCTGIQFENVAVDVHRGVKPFYRLREDVNLKAHGLPTMFEQLGSFDRNRILAEDVHHGDPNILKFITENTIESPVQCVTMSDLFAKTDSRQVDLLVIDVEGHEIAILNSINFAVNKPSFIMFESLLLGEKKAGVESLLMEQGYSLLDIDCDTLAFQDLGNPQKLQPITLPPESAKSAAG